MPCVMEKVCLAALALARQIGSQAASLDDSRSILQPVRRLAYPAVLRCEPRAGACPLLTHKAKSFRPTQDG